MDNSALHERTILRKVPFVVEYGQGNGDRLFRVCPPEGNRNRLFWHLADDSLNFSIEDLSESPTKREMLVRLASVAISIGEPYSPNGKSHHRASIDECFRSSLGRMHEDSTDAWMLSVNAALQSFNGGEALPEQTLRQIDREFYGIVTGGNGVALHITPQFEDWFVQAMRSPHQSTGHLIEGLKTSVGDPRLLYVTNAMVLAYAKTMNALNPNY